MSNVKLTSNPQHTFSYDEWPYESYPYSQSAPEHLATLAKLFGMNPADHKTSRILELGSSAGWNIIPHAMNNPKAEYVGVDLSKVEIDEAKKHVKELGLKNITFHEMSISDIDESFGKFDYIICHGIISWVPEDVRKRIFEVTRDNLTTNGIAYISYNTKPGWNMVNNIRDMMLYHSKLFPNVQDKVAQGRLVLDFIVETLEGTKNPYAESLQNEAKIIKNQSDHYLRHDHLSDINNQFYFHDFMDQAAKCDLQYLADTSVASMFIGNMPKRVVEKLQSIQDIVRTEQYMDFINNRRFRSTLLCHKSAQINRNLDPNDIKKFNMNFNVQAEKPIADVDLKNSLESLQFYYQQNKDNNISTSSPAMKAILYTFAESQEPVNFDDLVKNANKKLGGERSEEITQELLNNAMRLVLQGYIELTIKDPIKYKKHKNPKISKIARYQAKNTNVQWIVNHHHKPIGINLFEKCAIPYMDGTNTKDQILEEIVKCVENKIFTINQNGKAIDDPEEIKKQLTKLLDDLLNSIEIRAISSLD
ncbi:MAG: methyltransferase regulatory domain-containing protein [Rickettsiaceae bacterium]